MRRHEGGIRLQHLQVTNFKGLDELVLDFPPIRMHDDPDIIVMGSKNGIGKTSVLEACVLLFLGVMLGKEEFKNWLHMDMPIDLPDLLVRAGTDHAVISGILTVRNSNAAIPIELSITRKGYSKITYHPEISQELMNEFRIDKMDIKDRAERFRSSLIGLSTEPLLLNNLLYFHSYRKVQEGNPELGMMVEREYYRPSRYHRYGEIPVSTFKLEILRSMMSQGGLFEDFDDSEAGDNLKTLNHLISEYAGGSIEKLRTAPDNTVEFRVKPQDGSSSFNFDGLSSGQKEIISTLFLIWKYTHKQPGIVLIDEPELHLNVEWHHKFISCLHNLAPRNQYIIATHSEDIFGSVEKDRRILLAHSEEISRWSK